METTKTIPLSRKIIIAFSLIVVVSGTVYAYTYPDLNIEDQKRVAEIQRQILEHKSEILNHQEQIQKLEDEKAEIESGKKKLSI